jgi:hypothetical protein
MDVQECPKTPKCPIFNGVLQGYQYIETYKSLYCLAGESGRGKCQRFQVSEKVGKCPSNVLPNSSKSVDEIIAEMKAKGELN